MLFKIGDKVRISKHMLGKTNSWAGQAHESANSREVGVITEFSGERIYVKFKLSHFNYQKEDLESTKKPIIIIRG